MYDPPNGSAREWVEVHNGGTSNINLSTWRFFENSINHKIATTTLNSDGVLPAGGYAVIASSPADFLKDFTYTGPLFSSSFSLSDSGEMLGIRDKDLADQTGSPFSYSPAVSGKQNKDGKSIQLTNDGTWIAALPTPGTSTLTSGNSGGSSSDSSNTDASTDAGLSPGSSGVGSEDSVMPPPPRVFADGGSDRIVVVGADTEFRARAYDEKENIIDFTRFHWNFGDGTTADTAVSMHRFEYPGRYVVVLDMPEEKDAVTDQIIVTVEQMKLALSLMEDGGVAIENRAGRTFDLSRWIIRSMERTFTVPAHTFILAGNSLRFSPKTLGFSSGANVELAYPNGALALGIVPTPVVSVASSTSTSIPAKYSSQTAVFEKVDDYAAVREVESSSVEQPDIATTAEETISAQAAGAGAALSGSSGKWWLGVVGIAGLAAGSLALARRYGKKEWDIIEESDEAV